MAFTIRRVEYYYANVRDELGAAYRVLAQLAELGVNLLAFTAMPSGPSLAQFALFPDDPSKLIAQARAAGLPLDGPYHALLVQGDDELGALANVHEPLVEARRGHLRVVGRDRQPGRVWVSDLHAGGSVREGRDRTRAVRF